MYSSKKSFENPYLNVYYIFKILMNLVNWKCDVPSGTTQGDFLLNNCAPKHALLLHYQNSKKVF
jgi:hypothetical protein